MRGARRPASTPKPMRVLGMMSGTSVDGVDVALVKISGAPPLISARLEAHHHLPFPPALRRKVLEIANGAPVPAAEISDLNFALGELYARAAIASCKRWRMPLRTIALIGSHGQTIFHLGERARFRGSLRAPSTLQIGDLSVIAQRTGITTVGDFRPADMAAGGQGAPLVPFVDYLLYRHARRGRVALNIGGIANVSVIPAGARPQDVFAFDTGPGNMLVDAIIERATHGRKAFDCDARVALSGTVLPELLRRLLRDPYFRKRPPKSAGREQFGRVFAERVMDWAARRRVSTADLARTVTLLTPLAIGEAFRRFILPRVQVSELIVAGGGARNPLMLAQLAAVLPGIEIVPAHRFGVPAEAKEAFAFAMLAYETYHQRVNNLPSATGASRGVVLGKIACGAARSARI